MADVAGSEITFVVSGEIAGTTRGEGRTVPPLPGVAHLLVTDSICGCKPCFEQGIIEDGAMAHTRCRFDELRVNDGYRRPPLEDFRHCNEA